jgi:hypothetical protein
MQLMSYSYTSEQIIPKSLVPSEYGITGTSTAIDSTLHLTDQASLQEAPLLVRRLNKLSRWNVCIGVARGITTKREHVSWHAGWYGCRHTRELHFGRVDRVVFNWA